MKIKTEIRYPYILEQIINKRRKNWNLKEFENFKNSCKKFEKLYTKHIGKIIKLIEKHSKNKEWQYNFIPINLISDKNYKNEKWSAFSDPLTIRIRKDRTEKRILKTLIHELVHVNLNLKEQLERNYESNEKIVENITNKVWEELKV